VEDYLERLGADVAVLMQPRAAARNTGGAGRAAAASAGGGGGHGTGVLAGDVTGPESNTFVSLLQGQPLTLSAPSAGQVLRWDGSAWVNGTEFKQIEVDFGATPTRYFNGMISDADITTNSKLMIVQSGDAATGRAADEEEMDPLLPRAKVQNGSFILHVTALEGPVVGSYRLNYTIG